MLAHRSAVRCPVTRSRGALQVRAFGDNHSTGKFKEGQKVKVASQITLYSVPKHPEGLNIEGMVGEVFKDVSTHKGKVLSATQPYVVKFLTELNGAPVKFQAHLAEEEIVEA